MKHSRAHQIIPAMVFAAAAAIPVGTAIEIVTHAPQSSAASRFTSVAAVAPSPRPTSTSQAVRKPKAAASTKPKPTAAPVKTTVRVYSGPVVYGPHSAIQAKITVSGRKIIDVAIVDQPSEARSASIDAQAIPLLRTGTLQSQNANVNTVSGATETRDAYAQSLQAALQTAHLA